MLGQEKSGYASLGKLGQVNSGYYNLVDVRTG